MTTFFFFLLLSVTPIKLSCISKVDQNRLNVSLTSCQESQRDCCVNCWEVLPWATDGTAANLQLHENVNECKLSRQEQTFTRSLTWYYLNSNLPNRKFSPGLHTWPGNHCKTQVQPQGSQNILVKGHSLGLVKNRFLCSGVLNVLQLFVIS